MVGSPVETRLSSVAAPMLPGLHLMHRGTSSGGQKEKGLPPYIWLDIAN